MTDHSTAPAPAGTPQPSRAPAEPRGGALPPAVAGFLARLRRLPLGAWAEAARGLDELDARGTRRPGGEPPAGGEALRSWLRGVASEMPHVASRTRRRVRDLAAVAQGFVHPAEIARMERVALAAALALVARPALGEERFARLYAPFAALIPVADLPTGSGQDVSAAWWEELAGPLRLVPGS